MILEPADRHWESYQAGRKDLDRVAGFQAVLAVSRLVRKLPGWIQIVGQDGSFNVSEISWLNATTSVKVASARNCAATSESTQDAYATVCIKLALVVFAVVIAV
jgi:hypothetical protein